MEFAIHPVLFEDVSVYCVVDPTDHILEVYFDEDLCSKALFGYTTVSGCCSHRMVSVNLSSVIRFISDL